MPTESFRLTPVLILLAVFAALLLVGLIGRSPRGEYYQVRGGRSGHLGTGAAIASNWMSAASFLGIAGIFYLKGYFALAYVIGWTGGYVLLLILMAGQIRRFGKYTAPEFVGDRYESGVARVLSAVVAILISLVYCVAQYKGIGLVFGWIFGLDYTRSLLLGTVAIISYLVLSGTLGATRNQRFQYIILLISFIVPLMWVAHRLGFDWLIPQFSYGKALQELGSIPDSPYTRPWAFGTVYQWCALCFTLMVGTVGLPHVLSRFYTSDNIRDARWSVVWGIFFIGLLYWSAPAYATFARVSQMRSGLHLDPAAQQQIADLIVVKAAQWSGVPDWITAVVAVGAITAAFYTVTGLLITGAGAFSYDIYYRFINPRASQKRLMRVAKGSTLVLAFIVLLVAVNPPGLIAQITAVAFALAGNTLFPVFLLGIWWGRANNYGAIAGMLTGIAITFGSLFWGHFWPVMGALFPPTSSALLGAPIVIVVMITVSLLTPPPSERIRRFLAEKVHQP